MVTRRLAIYKGESINVLFVADRLNKDSVWGNEMETWQSGLLRPA